MHLSIESTLKEKKKNKSRYFALTEFNNCFIIRSPSWFFNYLRSDLQLSRKSDRTKEKSVVSFYSLPFGQAEAGI